MSILKFEFEYKKMAFLKKGDELIKIADVEEYFDNNGKVRVTLRMDDNMPEPLFEQLALNPQAITITGQVTNPTKIAVIRRPQFSLPKKKIKEYNKNKLT